MNSYNANRNRALTKGENACIHKYAKKDDRDLECSKVLTEGNGCVTFLWEGQDLIIDNRETFKRTGIPWELSWQVVP